jgi:hypothetical protein
MKKPDEVDRVQLANRLRAFRGLFINLDKTFAMATVGLDEWPPEDVAKLPGCLDDLERSIRLFVDQLRMEFDEEDKPC